jgi:hypothetical protein
VATRPCRAAEGVGVSVGGVAVGRVVDLPVGRVVDLAVGRVVDLLVDLAVERR